ncbi:MAG: helix-turn-helix domain-containing protein [Lachnospiraceae bacterium]|nr:helix-turn-helix domain-containing protein [Lachnospiraceae bacterium]
MSRLALLTNALEYIEENLVEDIRTEDIAKACFCSKSTLEKLFQDMNHISIHDYIVRRRMMKGARILVNDEQASILDIALQVGYSSHEAFTRAFKQVWNCKPSQFRKQTKYTELFPRLYLPMEEWDDYMKTRRQYDISELYDLMVARKNCYFVCCDIKSLIPINEISRKAGDLAILEALNRMNAAAGEADVVFRIGGDEFVMMTGSEDESYAEAVKAKILAENGKAFAFEDKEIPLSLYAVTTKLDVERVKYNDVFCKLHEAIQISK